MPDLNCRLVYFQLLFFVLGCASGGRSHERIPAQTFLGDDSAPVVCNVRDFGAKADGHPDTLAIQAAIEACREKGGIVDFPPGNYVSGTIKAGSKMTLRLEAGATLVAVRDPNAFPVLKPPTENSQLSNCRRALIYAERADSLTIEGPGTIDGSGDFGPWQNVKERERPMAIFVVQGNGLRIQNLQVRNAAMWSVVLMETHQTNVSQLDIDSHQGNTRDGLDIVDGSEIHVDHVTVLSEDDAICLKSGTSSGLSNVWITNSHVRGSLVANGLKFGTASVGMLSNVHFENILIEHVAQAAMAIESVDGANIKDVNFQGITYHDTGTGIFVLLGWRGDQSHPRVGSISNLLFQNVSGESSRQAWGSALSGTKLNGITYAPKSIGFKNVRMQFKGDDHFTQGNLPSPPSEYAGQYPDPRMWTALPAQGLYFRHVENITLEETHLIRGSGLDARPVLVPDTGKVTFDAP